MAKKNTEAKEKATAAPIAPVEAEAPAAETAQTAGEAAAVPEPDGVVGNQNTELSDLIEQLYSMLPDGLADRASNSDVLEGVIVYIQELKARIAKMEGNAPAEMQQVYVVSPGDDKDLAAEAYDIFRKSQAEGDFPAWAELPEQTQKLWRDSYQHVAAGGEPRTDYEEAVKYLINSAQ